VRCMSPVVAHLRLAGHAAVRTLLAADQPNRHGMLTMIAAALGEAVAPSLPSPEGPPAAQERRGTRCEGGGQAVPRDRDGEAATRRDNGALQGEV
jgi:hypothetical protein